MNRDLKSTLCFPITAGLGLLVLRYEGRLLLNRLFLCCPQQTPLQLNRPLPPPTLPQLGLGRVVFCGTLLKSGIASPLQVDSSSGINEKLVVLHLVGQQVAPETVTSPPF